MLVDDFYDITPELLRSAYIEAIYHVNDFQFEKLTQDFWYDLLRNITHPSSSGKKVLSADKSYADYLFDVKGNSGRNTVLGVVHRYFPMVAEDADFTRPIDKNYMGVPSSHTCERVELGGVMGPCKRVPQHTC